MQGLPARTCGNRRHVEPTVKTEPGSPSPRGRSGARRGAGGAVRRVAARGSRGAPVAVVIAVGVAHGERQAGLALGVLLVALPRGTLLEEVRDVTDLEKTKGKKEGLGTPSCSSSAAARQSVVSRGGGRHSR